MPRSPASFQKDRVAHAFFRQAEADLKDAITLQAHHGHACTSLALIQSAAEKATKALLLSRSLTRAPFELVKSLSHQPLQRDSRSQKFLRKNVGREASKLILLLESMQPVRSTDNPRYTWMRDFKDIIETPATYFTFEHVDRFLPSVRRFVSAVRKALKA
jgi:HEPN domain-containing protein